MDDGGKLDYNKNSKNRSVVLNTHSFTEAEVKKMSEELAIKFNLDCTIQYKGGTSEEQLKQGKIIKDK